MPRDGSNIYTQPFPDVVDSTTIESTVYNGFVADIVIDLNTPRPIVAGGTGASNPDAALVALSGEKAKQVITNFDSTTWIAGSFYAATSATNPPVAAHAFAGIAYYANATDFVVEARDLTDPSHPLYIRVMSAGVWGAWALGSYDPVAADARFVNVAGDTMTGLLLLSADPAAVLGAVTKQYADAGNTAAKAYADVGDAALANSRVRYDAAQGLTAAQKAQARANIDALKKNYVINGAMMVSQENGGTAGTVAGYYPVDQFKQVFSNTSVPSIAQVASATPAGSPNRIRLTVTTADASVAAGDYHLVTQLIEGLRVADLNWGAASAKAITLQFGVKAPAGTYSIALNNGATNRSYVAEYVIAAGEANTDVIKSVTIPGDVAGAWLKDNGKGLVIYWSLMCGTTYQQVAGAWAAGGFLGSTNQFNFMGTVGNVFELFDVGLYEGSVAPAFVVPDFASELASCQRYWEKSYDYGTLPGTAGTFNGCLIGSPPSTTRCYFNATFGVKKRGVPTISVYGTSGVLGRMTDATAIVDYSCAANYVGHADSVLTCVQTLPNTTNFYLVHWAADARM